MIGIVYSKLDEAGKNMAEYLVKTYDFEEAGGSPNLKYQNGIARIYEVDVFSYQAEFVDSFNCDTIVFLSRHKSEAGIAALTTHSLGNWRKEAAFGGKPSELSFAAPIPMLLTLENLNKIGIDADKTYEATHHGPLLKTPSYFVELGGNEEVVVNKKFATLVAEASYKTLVSLKEGESAHSKVVVGIGSNHYPSKFSKLALEKGYAFSHILPKHAILNEDGTSNLAVLEQALTRSTPEPEAAVVDWKSLNSLMKEETLKKLEEMGLDYEKV
jgi:D-aminoacyl-tRNA deacylase